ncbi:MAG TPA: XRE family transcriptional regulator [Solirubrobacteraceae bacterium]|nr:XRE family transcriptional regulator [Solirubrobacteraceae bacterium]
MRGASETVGANVRRFRDARGMSLAELGRVSRLSKGTLTQLEAGLANPTVDTLHALSRALGTTLGDLVSDPPTVGPQIVRAAEGPRLQSWDGGARLVQRTLLGNAVVETYDLQLGADGVHRSPAHAAGVVEHLFVTGGQMRVGPEPDPTPLATWDSIRFDADQPHSYATVDGPASAVLTMFFPAVARIGNL